MSDFSVRPNCRTTQTNRTETGIGSVRFGSVDFTETTEPTEPAEPAETTETTEPTETAENTYIQGVKAKSMHLYNIAM